MESATYEEITTAGDCLICRENMSNVVTGCRKLRGCGHIFHVDCLRMWLQHQQSCPLCRAEIVLTASSTTSTSVTHPAGGAAAPGTVPTTDSGAAVGATSSQVEDVERDLLEYLQRDATTSNQPVEQTTPQPYQGTTSTTATAESTAPVMPTDGTIAPATLPTTTAISSAEAEAESTAALPAVEYDASRPLSPEYVKRVRQQYYQKTATLESPLPPPDNDSETAAGSNIEGIHTPAADAPYSNIPVNEPPFYMSSTTSATEAATSTRPPIKPFPFTAAAVAAPSISYTTTATASSSSHQHTPYTQQQEVEQTAQRTQREHILPNFFCVIKGTPIPPNPSSTSTGVGSEAVRTETAVTEVVTIYKDSNITSDIVRTIKKVRIITSPYTFISM